MNKKREDRINVNDVMICFAVSQEDKKKIKEKAMEMGVTVSAFLRIIVKKAIKEEI